MFDIIVCVLLCVLFFLVLFLVLLVLLGEVIPFKIGILLPNSNSGNLLSTPVLFNAAIDRALRCQDLPDFGSV